MPDCSWMSWWDRSTSRPSPGSPGSPHGSLLHCRTQEGWGQGRGTQSLQLSAVSPEEKLSKEMGKAHMGRSLKQVIHVHHIHIHIHIRNIHQPLLPPCWHRTGHGSCVFTAATGSCSARGGFPWEQVLLLGLCQGAFTKEGTKQDG